MSDPRAADQPQNDAFRARIEAWLDQQNQALVEQTLSGLRGALATFHPDEALLAELRQAALPPPGAADPVPTEAHLASALDLLEGAASQSDLLRRLLDALAPLAARSALFILKQGLLSLYSHRGFGAEAPLKTGAVMPPPELEPLVQGLGRSLRRRGPAYTALVSPIASQEAAEVAIFPLRHRRKVVALLLVDSGAGQRLEHPEQVRALVLATSAMLVALASAREDEPGPAPTHPAPAAQAQPPAPVAVPEQPTVLDPRTRAAAERLARVLVGDVEAYSPAEVAQARAHGNLYGRLKDDLERSRATFMERFGEDVELRYRIFTTTVIQHLCNGDVSKLGAAPWL